MTHAMKMTKIKEDKDFPITHGKNENANVCRAVKKTDRKPVQSTARSELKGEMEKLKTKH